MARNSGNGRDARLAAALKENLKRRKAKTRGDSAPDAKAPPARALGTAPQAGLENQPQNPPSPGPKGAPKTL